MNPNEEEEVTRSDRDALCADMELEELEAMRTRMRPVLTVMLLCAGAALAGIVSMIWFTDRLPLP